MGGVSGTKLTMQPLEKSVYKNQNWVEKQVSVSLAILDECLNNNGSYIKGLIADGHTRMTKQHRQITVQSLESSKRNWERLEGKRLDSYE